MARSPYIKLQSHAATVPDELDTWLGRASLSDRVSAERSTFTPFVGLGALQTDAETNDAETIPWDRSVEERFGVLGDDADPKAFFLKQLKETRADGRSFPAATASPELTEARISLLEAAFLSTELYATSWAGALTPVIDWGRHSVKLTAAELKTLRPVLKTAYTNVAALGVDAGFALLGSGGLGARLERIATELESTEELQSSVVEYLTDAFWHAMTFDAPMYPRYGELAMQVSMCLGEDHPRRRRVPPSAVERSEYVNFTESVKRSVERGFTSPYLPDSPRSKFYRALADTLHASHAWRLRVGPRPFKKPKANTTPAQPIVALSNTFDLELERALALTGPEGGIYHVAIPVFVEVIRRRGSPTDTDAGEGNIAELWWLVGDFRTTGGRVPDDAELTRPASPDPDSAVENGDEAENTNRQLDWRWLDLFSGRSQENAPDLLGPLILKINGSPLHVFQEMLEDNPGLSEPPPQLEPAPEARVYHAILLDEIDFIQSAHVDSYVFAAREMNDGSARGLPQWLINSLQSDHRYWILLGQRLSDWASKLNLFLQISRLRPASSRFVDIALDADPDRVRLLRWAGITSVEGDCRKLTRPLEDLTKFLAR